MRLAAYMKCVSSKVVIDQRAPTTFPGTSTLTLLALTWLLEAFDPHSLILIAASQQMVEVAVRGGKLHNA